ncbi:hypothetical protein ACPCXF_12075 [Lysinibacillus agricola]
MYHGSFANVGETIYPSICPLASLSADSDTLSFALAFLSVASNTLSIAVALLSVASGSYPSLRLFFPSFRLLYPSLP